MKFTYPPESRPLDGYTIKRAIQRGGFGEVYYALSDGGKEVALKLLRDNLEVELRGVTQCLNLKHPNLVTIFDVRTDAEDGRWIVMEYVRGQGLELAIDAHPEGMPVEEAERWLSGIAAGLSFLHDRGIVHRDLKPANIYREEGTVKIGDVGLSKFISESRRNAQTQSVGTVYYMAPEVGHGRYGHEVDVYALGVILYEMLTGRVPFDGESTAEILMKHLSERPDLSPVPRRLRPVLAAALEKDPLRRTPSVAQLLEEFRKAVRGIEIPSRAPAASPSGDFAEPLPEGFTEEHRGATGNSARPVAVRSGSAPAGAACGTAPHQSDAWKVWQWVAIGALVLLFINPRLLGMLGAITWSAIVVGIPVLVAYAAYRLVNLLAETNTAATAGHLAGRARPQPGAAGVRPGAAPLGTAPPGPPPPPTGRAKDHRPRTLTAKSLRVVSGRQRLTELTGAMSLAALCTALITGGLALVAPHLSNPSQIGLFAGGTLLGAWMILILAKFWEGTATDAAARRFVQLLAGLLVGGAAFWMSDTLLIHDLGDRLHFPAVFRSLGTLPLVENGQPAAAGYIVFFATLFGLRRWWRQAHPFRSRRLRVSSLLVTTGLAWLAACLWSFPVLWATTWAAAISGVVQLSSVWVPPAARRGAG